MKDLRSVILITALGTSGVAAIAQEEILVPATITPEPVMLEEDPDPPAPPPPIARLHPAIDSLMKATTNKFIGTARLHFSSTRGGKTVNWTVRYASTEDRMVLIGQDEQPGIAEHTRAFVIDRRAGTEVVYIPAGDSMRNYHDQLDGHFRSSFAPATADSIITGTRKLVGRTAQHRLLETEERRRESWVDVKTPSLFHDVLGARKSWGFVEILLRGPVVASTRPGMPLEVIYTHKAEKMVMKVLELKPGPVDEKAFEITKESWQ